ncbi:MAG TPA: hypothetical protein PLP22_02015 [Candidatus Competibacter sp.]|nr:hypothetical protein [Candidatus Competibacteraceae bacterium]HRE53552.1 hypothetical protein [Candidatus Competibacter sp.]HUM93266.1 hypothetical protein [Candidatus Competibacter sp.]
MSIQSAIESIIHDARILAANTTATANSLIATAAAQLNYDPRYPSSRPQFSDSGAADGAAGQPEIAEKVPSFPSIRRADIPDAPTLIDLDQIRREFQEKAPEIELPDFRYARPSALAAFGEKAPEIDTTIALPERPVPVEPERPNYSVLDTDIRLEPLTPPVANISKPTYVPGLLSDWPDEFNLGLSRVPNLEEYAYRVIERLFPGLRASLSALSERIDGILEGRATALTDRVEQAMYDGLKAKLALERERNLQTVDEASTATGWTLPGGARLAAAMRVETEYSRSANAAALEVYTKRAERELQHLQFVMELAARLQANGVTLFGQAVGLGLEGFKAALSYADSATRYAATAYELKQKDFQIYVQVMEAEIRLFEALLRVELGKAELVKARIEIEKLKSDINQQALQQYLGELKANETQASLYATQITSIRAELEARRVPLDIFETKIRAYVASADAKRAEYAALQAEIEGDKAKVDGEMAKVRLYSSKVDAFRSLVDADATKINAQAKRNESVLEEFKTRVQAEVALTQIDESVAKHALDAYDAMARIYIAQAEQDLARAKFAFTARLENAKFQADEMQREFLQSLKEIELELSRRDSLSKLHLSGAQVSGQVAGSALSALNSVVSLASEG